MNLSTNHPLIDSSQQYTIEKKYVSIHSEDRNILKYPNPSDFEIELPQDYINVSTVKLSSWSFPSNYNVFSIHNKNCIMTFKFVNIYNPNLYASPSVIQICIYRFLSNYANQFNTNDFIISIEEGFYNPIQMANELTNRFNSCITNYLSIEFQKYDEANGTSYNEQFLSIVNGVITGGYNDFIIAYNQVEQKLWFGNRSSSFSLTQNLFIIENYYANNRCTTMNMLSENLQPINIAFPDVLNSPPNTFPDNYINGLPALVGLNASDLPCITVTDPNNTPWLIPRFYYGNAVAPTDNGYWLTPDPNLKGSVVSYIEAPLKLNNMGPAYFYIDIAGLNYIDETSPFNVSKFTIQTNKTNGIVNSSFAKIAVTSTPLSQFYDTVMDSYKYFNPPAERIRKFRIKVRYHNGQYVDFNNFPYSFTLEFTLFTPQILRNLTATKSYTTL